MTTSAATPAVTNAPTALTVSENLSVAQHRWIDIHGVATAALHLPRAFDSEEGGDVGADEDHRSARAERVAA